MISERQVNLHTHTPLCRHAPDTVEEMCRTALEHNYKVMGFSEHAPLPGSEELFDRMRHTEIPLYLQQLEAARKRFPELTILSGWELDYVPDMSPYRKMYCEDCSCNFLLGSAHRVFCQGRDVFFLEQNAFDEEIMLAFLQASIQMLQEGLVDAIAHPDAAAGNYYGPFTPKIKEYTLCLARLSREKEIPLELNANGIRKGNIETAEGSRWRYPWVTFWKTAAEEHPPVIVSADAHRTVYLHDEAMDCVFDLADDLHLKVVNAECARKWQSRRR